MALLSYRIGALKETPELRNELNGKDVVVWRNKNGHKGYVVIGGMGFTLNPTEIHVFKWKYLWEGIDSGKWDDSDEVVPVKEYIKIPVLEEVEK